MKKFIYILSVLILSSALNAQSDRSQPKPGPAPKVNVGKPQTFTLDNGLKVMVVENHKLPRVMMMLDIDNPPYAEGAKKGIDDMTGSLIGNGTSKISKDAFQEEFDFMGADINFNSSGAYASTLSNYFPRVMELLAQGTTDPLFTQEDFDKEIARYIDGLKTEEKSVKSNAQRVENVLAYGVNHPFGEFVTEEKLKGLTLADVKNHYKNYFAPNNAYLVILGDVKLDEVKKLVQKDFGSWKKGNIPTSTYPDPKNISKTEIDFVDVPNAVQSEVSIFSTTNLKMTDKDYFPTLMANHIFGGDFNSYLNMSLREAHGWTYGARSSIRGDRYVGKFKASAAVRNEVTDSAVVEAIKELKRIRSEKVADEALATAKATYIGSFVMDAEKPEMVAQQALRTQTQGLPDNFYQNYIQNINAVTADDVMKAAQKYFSVDNARILVVGKASDVLPSLEKLPYQINYYDRFGNPTSKPEQKKADASVTVKSVMDKYIAAIGGEKTKSIKNYVATYEAEMQGMKLNLQIIKTSDGKSLEEVTMMGQPISRTVFDGKVGSSTNQGQTEEMDAEELASYQYEALPFPELKLSDKPGVKLSGIENFNGKDVYAIVDGKKTSYYDVKTGLNLGSSAQVEAQGQTMNQVTKLGNYKEFEGIKFPEEFTINFGMDIVFKVVDIKLNADVSKAKFN